MRAKIVASTACLEIVACAPTIWDKPGATEVCQKHTSGKCILRGSDCNR